VNKLKYSSFIFAHIAIFIIYVWFGAMKFFGVSPANNLVEDLLEITLPFIPFHIFIYILGAFEIIVGILFLIPKARKVAIILLFLHMITTFLPLILLPHIVWQFPFVPTLEG